MSVVDLGVDAIKVTNSLRKGAHRAVELNISIQRDGIAFVVFGHLVGMTIRDCSIQVEHGDFARSNGLLFQVQGIQSHATKPEPEAGAIQLNGERREVDGLEVQSKRCGLSEIDYGRVMARANVDVN